MDVVCYLVCETCTMHPPNLGSSKSTRLIGPRKPTEVKNPHGTSSLEQADVAPTYILTAA